MNSFFEDATAGRPWQVVLVVACYALVCYATNHILIARPSRHQLLEKIDEEYALLALSRTDDHVYEKEISGLLQGATAFVSVLVPIYKRSKDREPRFDGKRITHPLLTLSKVLAGWRMVHAADRIRVCSSDENYGLIGYATIAVERLRRIGRSDSTRLATHLEDACNTFKAPSDEANVKAAIADLRVLLMEGLRVSYEYDERELETAAEGQRRAMWLTVVGLLAVTLFGLGPGRSFLLFGALGGFLAPLTQIWQTRRGPNDYATSWGVLMLSPVAGAIAAYAGLLLVRLLADGEINVLGEVFRDNSWDTPTSTLAIGLALLFGFSGTLLSRVALAADKQVVPPSPGIEAAPRAQSGDGTDIEKDA